MTAALDAVRTRLAGLEDTAPDDDLLRLAAQLATSDGRIPLLGSGFRAEPFPALQWNGTRLHREGVDAAVGLLLVARAAGADGDADEERAVDAGLRVASRLPAVVPGGAGAADPGLPVLAAAVTAAVASAASANDGDDRARAVVDLAGVLAVVGPPPAHRPSGADMRAGHALAAGWFAAQLLDSGITSAPGAALVTASAVTGRSDLAWPDLS